jgi:hypothetical protein
MRKQRNAEGRSPRWVEQLASDNLVQNEIGRWISAIGR